MDVGGYVLKEKLGAGSFGQVFLAEQDGRLLAVKLIALAGLGNVRLVLGMARALAAVHGAKALHRDVKEANIVVREAGGEAVLVDFGVGTYENSSHSPRVLPPGTRNYLSPEAWRFSREHASKPGGGYASTPRGWTEFDCADGTLL